MNMIAIENNMACIIEGYDTDLVVVYIPYQEKPFEESVTKEHFLFFDREVGQFTYSVDNNIVLEQATDPETFDKTKESLVASLILTSSTPYVFTRTINDNEEVEYQEFKINV